jgi:hypothetical protein
VTALGRSPTHPPVSAAHCVASSLAWLTAGVPYQTARQHMEMLRHTKFASMSLGSHQHDNANRTAQPSSPSA